MNFGRRTLRSLCPSLLVSTVSLVLCQCEKSYADSNEIELWRMDCGEFVDLSLEFESDDFAYSGKRRTLTNSCYLIRHGREYMLWDSGFSRATLRAWNASGVSVEMNKSLADQLRQIQVNPKQISIVGISHVHPDHTGQLPEFPWARLLIGKADYESIASQETDKSEPLEFLPWISGGSKKELVTGDRDVFGDGSVVMLDTRGHTLGHHSLLVRLQAFGPVILTGDLWSLHEQIPNSEMSAFTMDRASALASMDRIKKAAAHLSAKIIVQHDNDDVRRLPLFPASAR